MANIIKVRRSATPAAVPTTAALALGELAINTNDGKLFLKKSVLGVETIIDVTAIGGVTTFSAGTTGLTPAAATGGAVVLAGTLAIANGGTNATTAAAALTSLGAYAAANPSGYTSNTGTVTGVTATSPVASSGGTAPVISMAAATAVANGYMTSTYAAKLDGIAAGATANTGTVTSVSGTGTVSGLTLSGTVTGTGSLTLGGAITGFPTGSGTSTGTNTGDQTNISGNAETATTASGVSAGVVAGKMIYDNFTATASQTTFTTSVAYTSSKIEVFCNGCKMVNGADVTVTSGTSVVFAFGLAVGSLVNLVYPT